MEQLMACIGKITLTVLSFISQNISNIFAVLAIIATFAIAIIQLFKVKRQKSLMWQILLLCSAVSILMICGKCYFDSKYSSVPDINGLTYNDAIIALKEQGLSDRLILASTNDLSSETTRVVWQSLSPRSIVIKGNTCIFLLDNHYQSAPSSVLDRCFLKMKTLRVYQSLSCDAEFRITSKVFIQSDARYDESKEETSLLGYVHTLASDTPYYSYGLSRLFGDAVANIIEKTSDIESDILTYSTPNLNNAFLFGRLVFPSNEVIESNIEEFEINQTSCVVAIPTRLEIGSYKFSFSIVDSKGTCYEGSFPVDIN